jgi:diguanylate cyclase (GGDEF)-like protein
LYNVFLILLILFFIGLNYIYEKEEIIFNKNNLQKLTDKSNYINEYFSINKAFIFSLKNTFTNNLQINELSHPAFNEIKENKDTYNIQCVLDNIKSSLNGTGKLEEIDIDTVQELHSVLYLKPLFKTILNSEHDIEWVYYTSAKNFIYLAPTHQIWGKDFLEKQYKKEFWTEAIPDNNPSEGLVITKLYKDGVGKGYMTTLSLPIIHNEVFMGVLSIDIGLKSLNRMVADDKLPGAIYLLNEYNEIIASNKKFKLNDVITNNNIRHEIAIFDDMITLIYIENNKEKIISILKDSLSQIFLLIFVLSIIYILSYLVILIKKIENLANKDSLTALLNRRAMRTESKKQLNTANRYTQNLSLLLLDIDLFKNVNDTYGHHIGDITIKEISKILSKNIRETDLASRYGGEEFLIMLSNTDNKSAFSLAERIRKEISVLKIKNTDLKVSVSIGCTQYIKDEELDAFINRADLLLYKAKNEGRNRTIKG